MFSDLFEQMYHSKNSTGGTNNINAGSAPAAINVINHTQLYTHLSIFQTQMSLFW